MKIENIKGRDILELEVRVLGLLRNFADGHSVEMLIGGYGDFDDLAYRLRGRSPDRSLR